MLFFNESIFPFMKLFCVKNDFPMSYPVIVGTIPLPSLWSSSLHSSPQLVSKLAVSSNASSE
ncbi:hypothetical protein Syun_015122 [Stephania yunnanensis]|uniref:Uncharacterized protein n=1 Tax=Stephania yunnanensis TaxID=152371 RepID=A0AAP0JKQ8_9MAGN